MALHFFKIISTINYHGIGHDSGNGLWTLFISINHR